MLNIIVPRNELFDEKTSTFIEVKEIKLSLEHSLVSISKWESKWHKPFITDESKTREELLYYIKCMTITQNVDDNVYKVLTNDNIEQINAYISDSMTATTFSDNKKGSSKQIITSELIYYWMIAYQIPVEFQKWHLNRLLTLIKVCEIKNAPDKKHSKREIFDRNRAINEANKKRFHTNG